MSKTRVHGICSSRIRVPSPFLYRFGVGVLLFGWSKFRERGFWTCIIGGDSNANANGARVGYTKSNDKQMRMVDERLLSFVQAPRGGINFCRCGGHETQSQLRNCESSPAAGLGRGDELAVWRAVYVAGMAAPTRTRAARCPGRTVQRGRDIPRACAPACAPACASAWSHAGQLQLHNPTPRTIKTFSQLKKASFLTQKADSK